MATWQPSWLPLVVMYYNLIGSNLGKFEETLLYTIPDKLGKNWSSRRWKCDLQNDFNGNYGLSMQSCLPLINLKWGFFFFFGKLSSYHQFSYMFQNISSCSFGGKDFWKLTDRNQRMPLVVKGTFIYQLFEVWLHWPHNFKEDDEYLNFNIV